MFQELAISTVICIFSLYIFYLATKDNRRRHTEKKWKIRNITGNFAINTPIDRELDCMHNLKSFILSNEKAFITSLCKSKSLFGTKVYSSKQIAKILLVFAIRKNVGYIIGEIRVESELCVHLKKLLSIIIENIPDNLRLIQHGKKLPNAIKRKRSGFIVLVTVFEENDQYIIGLLNNACVRIYLDILTKLPDSLITKCPEILQYLQFKLAFGESVGDATNFSNSELIDYKVKHINYFCENDIVEIMKDIIRTNKRNYNICHRVHMDFYQLFLEAYNKFLKRPDPSVDDISLKHEILSNIRRTNQELWDRLKYSENFINTIIDLRFWCLKHSVAVVFAVKVKFELNIKEFIDLIMFYTDYKDKSLFDGDQQFMDDLNKNFKDLLSLGCVFEHIYGYLVAGDPKSHKEAYLKYIEKLPILKIQIIKESLVTMEDKLYDKSIKKTLMNYGESSDKDNCSYTNSKNKKKKESEKFNDTNCLYTNEEKIKKAINKSLCAKTKETRNGFNPEQIDYSISKNKNAGENQIKKKMCNPDIMKKNKHIVTKLETKNNKIERNLDKKIYIHKKKTESKSNMNKEYLKYKEFCLFGKWNSPVYKKSQLRVIFEERENQ